MVSAAHRAYEALRKMILEGDINEGAPLREEHLAEVLGVSRTPIREAIRRLDAEGLVKFTAHQGAHVTSWSPDDLDEIFALRAMIEGWAAAEASRSISDDTIETLRTLARQMVELGGAGGAEDLATIAEMNNAFHRLVAEASGSRHVSDLREQLVQLPLVHRTFHRYSEQDLRRSLGHHGELVDALAARDADWAEAVMRSHILAARHALREGDSSEAP